MGRIDALRGVPRRPGGRRNPGDCLQNTTYEIRLGISAFMSFSDADQISRD